LSFCRNFKDSDIVILPDNDEPGRKHKKLVASKLHGVAKRIRILELPGLRPKGDIADWLAAGGTREELLRLIEGAQEYSGNTGQSKEISDSEFEAEVKRCVELPKIRYERERESAASKLDISVSRLDKLVNDERKGREPQGQGCPLEFPEPEPWPEPVSGAGLLDEIDATFSRFIVCDPAAHAAMALWIVATWFEPVAKVAPILNITSPELRCGKSNSLAIISKLAKTPLTAANITPAAVFRTIEKHTPTLLIDEADAFLGENEELRGLINSGHTRETAFFVRTVGDEHEPRQFSTWGFKAIAGIGKRAATIEDRAITISLKRKLAGEKVERLRHTVPGLFDTLGRKLARFAADNMERIAKLRPHLPEALNDRAQDNWEPLLAIADVAGGPWPQKAREAALGLSGSKNEAASLGEELLRDIQDIFAEKAVDRIAGADLVAALLAMAHRPWGEANRGKPITQAWLARRLGEFGIRPKNTRIGSKVPKGYEREMLQDAFARYLSPFQSATSLQSNEINDLNENKSATTENHVALSKSANQLKSNECSGVAVRNPHFPENRDVPDETTKSVADGADVAGKATQGGPNVPQPEPRDFAARQAWSVR
jgi:putative DNA primase/helicase